MSSNRSLAARRLSLTIGGHQILYPMDLSFHGGELVALLGPSGSGKSSLLRALSGFRPGKGLVQADNVNLVEEHTRFRRRIGYVPQDDILHRALKVGRALRYAAALRLPEANEDILDAAVTAVLAQVGLSDRRKHRVRQLSGGQRKRVSVAMELLLKPDYFFLDEPTSGLDPQLEEQLMVLLRQLTTDKRITIVTTHVLASLEHVDRLVVLCAGRLAFVGPPDDAPGFFGVKDLPSIYRALAKGDPGRFERDFLNSSHHAASLRAPS